MQFDIYKNCMGYLASYNEVTGLHDKPPYAAWDGPNCTGNLLIITDVPGDGMNVGAMEGGMVFSSPLPGDTTVYQIVAGQTPQSVQIQSSINTDPTGNSCSSPDIEVRMVMFATKNDGSVNGVPDSLLPESWTQVAP